MSPIITVAAIGTLAGILGTGIGGLISVITCNRPGRTLSFMLALPAELCWLLSLLIFSGSS